MNVVKNYTEINLEKQKQQQDSIYNQYKTVFSLRKQLSVASGTLEFIDLDNNDHYIYTNETPTHDILVVANFRNKDIDVELPLDVSGYVELLSNCTQTLQKDMHLEPYDALVYVKEK